ncbi:putative Dipeptidyl-peptidase [Blattamonas nauphoetae]|uniref:Dipeptidyl-peptidase n=1 Tax=Blattamonas nauphoetae TaxID=2049346 RepID=A0ABQ9XVM2_9EUKA|nr:putative Dipeptidyl-peptidase [Blattamonas nauphoetae]
MLLPLLLFSIQVAKVDVFTENEFVKVVTPTNLVSSPSGSRMAYLVSTYNLEDGTTTSTLTVTDLTTDKDIKVTQPNLTFSSLIWSHSEEELFAVCVENGKHFLQTIDSKTGKFISQLSFSTPVSNVQVSKDKSLVAYVTKVFPGMTPAQTAEELQKRKSANDDMLTFDRLPVRDWNIIRDGTIAHIILHDTTTKLTTDITPEMKFDVGVSVYGNGPAFTLSPDTSTVVYSAMKGEKFARAPNMQIFSYDIKTAKTTQLTEGQYFRTSPVFDPRGEVKQIVYLTTITEKDDTDQTELVLYDYETNTHKPIAREFGYGVNGVQWSLANPSQLLIINAEEGRNIARVYDLSRMQLGERLPIYSIHEACFAKINNEVNIISILSRYDSFPAIYKYSLADKNAQSVLIRDHNNEFRDKYTLVPPIDVRWVGARGEEIHGFFIPALFQYNQNDKTASTGNGRRRNTATKAPFIVNVHGGPESVHLDQWSSRWNPQLYAHKGYCMLLPNPHGSASYGRPFRQSVHCNWETFTYDDVITGVAYILSSYDDYADSSRVGAVGASYGGFMMNVINGRTHLFKALVNHAGCFDQFWMRGESDITHFVELQFGGTPHDNEAQYRKSSPSFNVTQFDTPTLILQGHLDFRVPESNSVALAQAMLARGVPNRLVIFETECHWILKKKNVIRWYQEIFGWLDQWV